MKKIATFEMRFLACRFFTILVLTFTFLALFPGQNSHAKNFDWLFSNKAERKPVFQTKRNYISIVGSSTVYPFTAIIAEKFGRRFEEFRTPTVEATGTGGGMKLFCSGVGDQFPDFVNASRQIKSGEKKDCHKNGVNGIVEIKIGYDGIVVANSRAAKRINLTKKQIFLALADKIPQDGKLVNNPIKKWSQIDKRLPNFEIRIYGPPTTSGTRDAFVELVMEEFCVDDATFIKTYPDKKTRQKMCQIIRSDGHFIEAGENDNLILQKLNNDHEAFGIFGFSFLSENENSMQAATISGVKPSFQTIIDGRYSVSRPLFIYFKKEHFSQINGMKEFVQTIISKDTLGKDGFLAQKGLIPLSDSELRRMRSKVLKSL